VTTLTNGSYNLRVRTVTAAGDGAASSDVPFTVGPIAPFEAPLPPRDLRAEVNGQDVLLTWNLPTESTAATSYVIEVGSLPGLTNLGAFDTGSAAVSLFARNLNPGVYFVQLRARNAFGVSAPSQYVTIAIGGSGCTTPFPPSSLNATVVGSLVTLNWVPPVLVGTISGYVIEVGSSSGLTNIARFASGPATVLTAAAPSGVYFVRVRAQSTCGLTGASNEVRVVVP
jgi:predicted phage tail protein